MFVLCGFSKNGEHMYLTKTTLSNMFVRLAPCFVVYRWVHFPSSFRYIKQLLCLISGHWRRPADDGEQRGALPDRPDPARPGVQLHHRLGERGDHTGGAPGLREVGSRSARQDRAGGRRPRLGNASKVLDRICQHHGGGGMFVPYYLSTWRWRRGVCFILVNIMGWVFVCCFSMKNNWLEDQERSPKAKKLWWNEGWSQGTNWAQSPN